MGDIEKELGSAFRFLRESKNISRKEISGVSYCTVYDFEMGRRKITLQDFLALLDETNTSFDEFRESLTQVTNTFNFYEEYEKFSDSNNLSKFTLLKDEVERQLNIFPDSRQTKAQKFSPT